MTKGPAAAAPDARKVHMPGGKHLGSCYALLGLRPGSSLEEVEESYRSIVTRWDRYQSNPDALLQRIREERLGSVRETYESLVCFLASQYAVASGVVPETACYSEPAVGVRKDVDVEKTHPPREYEFASLRHRDGPSIAVLGLIGFAALTILGCLYWGLIVTVKRWIGTTDPHVAGLY